MIKSKPYSVKEDRLKKMKYANIVFSGKEFNNLGDNIQLIAIDKIYNYMGILDNDICKIPYGELSTWKSPDNEKVILPINFPFLEYKENGIIGTFSEDIIPVFLGLTLLQSKFSTKEIDYLKRYEPIGCRDEYTYYNLRRAGIASWLNGCITFSVFPQRETKKTRKKVFVVDVCDELKEYIPSWLRKNIYECSQIVKLEDKNRISEFARKRYEEYSEDAKLVVTSRLHCVVPCLSMGIPVILAVKNVSYRFGWVEKLLPIYTPDTFDQIDWNPCPIDFTDIKKQILDHAVEMIMARDRVTRSMHIISNFYLTRDRKQYFIEGFHETIEYIHENWDTTKVIEYSFWGITYLAELLDDYIKENYPNAILANVFDKYRKISFKGIKTEPISEINVQNLYNLEIFITASAVTEEAKTFFNKIGKNKGFYLCYLDMLEASNVLKN